VPETRIKTIINGQTTEASDVPIVQSNEDWREYRLEDGSTLRIKFAVGSVMRLDDFDADGNPIYVVKGTLLTIPLVVPDSLKKKA